MKRKRYSMGMRLFCLGAAISLWCSSTSFAIEYVPPNPLTPGVTSETTADVGQGQPLGSSGINGALVVEGGSSQENNAAVLNPPGETTLPTTVNPPEETSPSETVPPSAETNSPSAETGPSETVSQPSALEGTVFSGSSKVSAPVVAAEGAVLLNCGTGQILFEKNGKMPFYPASITKIMTALLTVENCSLEDVVTFSRTATTNLESGAVTISLMEGDQLTVRDSLYALLLKSANEVANGLAEHMGGSVDNFALMMNNRAAQLGCTGTHFANPNGLNNATHMTTPYDMSLIARAAYANPVISQISTTTAYQMPATKLSGPKTITMGHKMLYSTDSRYYPGMVGGKTGYTSKAGNTLVTCVEQNGVRLIVVIMKASGTHYTDTKALLDYGFALAANGEI
ncbi:MAG: D-alanyl-D-alanine carboxypeptidase [Lachnospiraceae bacterium]|nr:D-alanyl-D-alanine carboxypeptidase [Lachnospiraceae bacterium]